MINDVNKRIDYNEAKQLVSQLVRIPSENPVGKEEEIAEFTYEKLNELGLKVKKIYSKPRRPNVVSLLTGKMNKPVLMFNGHLDTVPIGDESLWSVDPFGGISKNGRVYGRGAADMKGGIVSMILALKAIIESNISLNGNLLLALVVDEEISGIGTKDLLKKGYVADAAIVGECTNLKVHNSHRGILNFEISVFGKSAHASLPYQGINAIYKMSKICLALEKYQEILKKNAQEQEYPTINVGTIQGGIKTNVIPDMCRITVDRRILPKENYKDAIKNISSILTKIIKEERLKVTFETILYAEPSFISKNERIMILLKKAMEEINLIFKPSSFPATCDMRFLKNQAKIPTVIFGPGNIENAHVVDEYVEIEQVVKAAKVYSNVALNMLS